MLDPNDFGRGKVWYQISFEDKAKGDFRTPNAPRILRMIGAKGVVRVTGLEALLAFIL